MSEPTDEEKQQNKLDFLKEYESLAVQKERLAQALRDARQDRKNGRHLPGNRHQRRAAAWEVKG